MTVTGAIWRDQLTPDERAMLGRADGAVAGARPDVLVVGGGILGVTTAFACADAGLGEVLLIETGRLGAGSTGGATGLLIPEPHQWSDPARPAAGAARRSWPGGARLARAGATRRRIRRPPAT
jgi:glycine/D-amino acid oxidase-like deaminating enzyme